MNHPATHGLDTKLIITDDIRDVAGKVYNRVVREGLTRYE